MSVTVATRSFSAASQRCSYVAVGGASLLGLLFPAAAPLVLGPVLLVGLVGLGLAHGACDQLVLPALAPARRRPGRRMLLFVLGYLGLAAAAGLGWWGWPAGAVCAFLLLTVWHWGSADAPARPGQRALWLAHSLLRGSLLFAVPARWWPAAAQRSLSGLLVLAGAAPLPAPRFAAGAAWLWLGVVAGHLVLWACYWRQRERRRVGTDGLEVGLLTLLFVALPPLLALGVYFVFWHSLQHALRLTRLLGYSTATDRRPAWAQLGQELLFFGRRALPLLLVSLAGLAGAYCLLPTPQLAVNERWLGLALVAAAVLTVPHAVLVSVVMDAAKWQPAWKTTPHAAARQPTPPR